MEENKIPLLTEVYQPKTKVAPSQKPADPTLGITPELIERVTSHVRPRLVNEIAASVLESVQYELKKNAGPDQRQELDAVRLSLEDNMRNFVDKAKADLKTDLPRMCQITTEMAHKDFLEKVKASEMQTLDHLQTLASGKAGAAIDQINAQVAQRLAVLEQETADSLGRQLQQQINAFTQSAQAQSEKQLAARIVELTISAKNTAETELAQHMLQQQETLQSDFNQTLAEARSASEHKVTEYLEAAITAITERTIETEAQYKQRLTAGEETITTQLATLEATIAQRTKDAEAEYKQRLGASEEAITKRLAALEATIEERLNRLQSDADAKVQTISKQLDEVTHSTYANVGQVVREQFAEEMNQVTFAAHKEFMAKVNGDLPDVQAILMKNIDRILAERLPYMETEMRTGLSQEIRTLLQQVKFVLP